MKTWQTIMVLVIAAVVAGLIVAYVTGVWKPFGDE